MLSRSIRTSLRKWRQWRHYLFVVVTAYVLTLAFATLFSPLRVNLENLVFDQYQRWFPRPYDFDQPVRIVDIDDESIHLVGRWPWSRQTMADLVETLAKAGVAAIGFDVLFSEKDRPTGDLEACARSRVLRADETTRCEERADADVAFADAISGRPVVLGVFLTATHNGAQGSLMTKAGFSYVGGVPAPFLNRLYGAIVPIPELADAASGLGFFSWLPDNDRVVRRVPLLLDLNGQIEPSLALETLRVAQGASGYIVKSTGAFGQTSGKSVGVEAIKVGDLVIPTQADGSLRVWFAKSDPRRSVPAWKVLQPDPDLADLAGKIVFVGASASLLADIVATPLDPSTPGVEVHAQLDEQLLSGVTLERPDWAPGAELAASAAQSLALAAILPFLTISWTALTAAAAAAAVCAVSWHAFAAHGVLLDPVEPSLSSGFVFLCGVGALYSQKREQVKRLESELRLGHDIQMSFLRKVFPAFPDRSDFSLYATIEPAREVGGDLYGFALVDENRLVFYVGDVADKGVPAALVMAETMTLMRLASQQTGVTPAGILRQVNMRLAEGNENVMFVTLFLGILNVKTGELAFSNAGHNPPLIFTADGECSFLTLPDGLVLGVMPEAEYRDDVVRLEPGAMIVTYTDGVTEAMNPHKKLYSESRLQETLTGLRGYSVEDTIAAIFSSVKAHAAGAPQSDDITVLAVKRN
jgi:serine phosphatase RsbU (regulator of sigma subunit)/CHASE2 domain-containing sensor protein